MVFSTLTALVLTAAEITSGEWAPSSEYPIGTRLTSSDATGSDAEAPVAADPGIGAYFVAWSQRVAEARASQPEWLPPLMTLSPLLTELVRWDTYSQRVGNGDHSVNFGGGKGIFLVPTTSNEVDVGLPSYQRRDGPTPSAGWTDWQFLLVKQRLLSAGEAEGNYILTTALAIQAPVGSQAFSNHTYVITPSLMGGKGFGDLNIQASTGVAIPTSYQPALGTTWSTNVTAQYRINHRLWPELEANWTHWLNGSRDGLDQLFLTVGLLAGPVTITRELKVAFGVGYQFAVAPAQQLVPAQTPLYHNNLIFSARVLF
jgi:hypothetical protein